MTVICFPLSSFLGTLILGTFIQRIETQIDVTIDTGKTIIKCIEDGFLSLADLP